jgi:hypothetical protein
VLIFVTDGCFNPSAYENRSKPAAVFSLTWLESERLASFPVETEV